MSETNPNRSQLDQQQILQRAFDESEDRLRVDTEATVVAGAMEVLIDSDSDSIQVKGSNGNSIEPDTDGGVKANIRVNNDDVDNLNAVPVTLRDSFSGVAVTTATNNGYTGVHNIPVSYNPNNLLAPNKESGGVSSNNTTTPLLAGATWTGTWVEAAQYSCISFTIQTDVDSAANGVRVQYSHDGVNIIRQSVASQIGSANGVFYSLPIHARYARLFFQNGAVNQTTFNVDCQLHEEYNGLAAVPLSLPLADTVTATTVKSVSSAKSPDGFYVNDRGTGVASANSSTTPLSAGATFTGAWEDVGGYTNISITVRTSHDSATDGLVLQYSIDGVTADAYDNYTVAAGANGAQYTVGVTAKYFRVVYTNGSSPQSTFRLQTVYHTTAPKPSCVRASDVITGENDTELVKAILTGRNPDGFYTNESVQGLDSANSSTTTLAANDIFRGTWFRWSESYSTLVSFVTSDVAGTLYVESTSVVAPTNGVDTDVEISVPVDFDPDVALVSRRNTPVQSRWVRHKYVNGTAAQSSFSLGAIFTTTDPGDVYLNATQIPQNSVLVSQHRAIQTIPTADGTEFQNIPVDSSTGNPKVTVSNVRDDILLRPLSTATAGQVVVGTTATRLDISSPSNRRAVFISNDGPSAGAIGFSSGITYNSGSIRMPVGAVRTMNFSEDVQIWGVSQDTGGSVSTLQRSPASASGTATNPSNVLSSNGSYANITAAAQTINATGYTAGTSNSLVSVKLGMEANRTAGGTQVAAHVATVTGSAGDVGTISTSSAVTGVTNQLYLAAISRESTTAAVNSVSGLGLTWTQVGTVTAGGVRTLDVWKAQGTVSGSTTVTANFSNTATNCHIAVSRYSGVSTSTNVQAFATATGTSTTPTTSAIASTENGIAYMAVVMDNHTSTAGAGYTELSDEVTAIGANRDGLTTEFKAITVTGTETPTCTLDSSVTWGALGLTLTPAPVTDPTVTLSYTLSAVPGATSGVATVSSTSDTNYYLDITSDRAWVPGDIANIAAIATGTSITATVNVDWLFVELIDTTGNTTRFSIMQGAEAVV